MMDIATLTKLGLEAEAAQKLLEQLDAEVEQRLEAGRQELPRVLAATPGGGCAPDLFREFAVMGYGQRLRLKQENPELYKELAENR